MPIIYKPLILDAKTLIKNASDNIDNNIEILCPNYIGLCSQNILSQVRNIIDGFTILKYYQDCPTVALKSGRELIDKAFGNMKGDEKTFRSFIKLHNQLQIVASHFTQDLFSSQSLIIKFKEYLEDIKEVALKVFGIQILQNIDKYPFQEDSEDDEYYETIYNILHNLQDEPDSDDHTFYIEKKRKRRHVYEYVLSPTSDKRTKFDHLTVFSLLNIPTNHSIKCTIHAREIELRGMRIYVSYIANYIVSIRPCEINMLSKLLKMNLKIKRDSGGYSQLMSYLTSNECNLYETVMRDDFELLMSKIGVDNRTVLHSILLNTKRFIESKSVGSNVIRYLLHLLRHDVMKFQITNHEDSQLSGTALKQKCYAFELNPYSFSLVKHNPRLIDLIECMPELCSNEELLKRTLITNIENKKVLYTPKKELDKDYLTDDLINQFNKKIVLKTEGSRIILIDDKYVSIKSYEEHTISIINKLKGKISAGDCLYARKANDYLNTQCPDIDNKKKDILKTAFINSSLVLINGSAGTGKTTIIKHFSNILSDTKILFLSWTHSAVENLKKRVGYGFGKTESDYLTIEKYLNMKSKGFDYSNYKVLVVDECSIVDNESFDKVLMDDKFEKVILVGDEHQIESIKFGNWFGISNILIPECSHELDITHRTDDDNLKNIWQQTRELKEQDNLYSRIIAAGYYSELNKNLFIPEDDDEVILCLNYDGLYGINNINKYLQDQNDNTGVAWKVWKFKKEDKIIFNENALFREYFYNNQKGIIDDITDSKEKVTFVVRVKSEDDNRKISNDLVKYIKSDNNYDYYEFSVFKDDDDDEEEDIRKALIVPFQLGYAISIHKSQGLEFNSVKIVFTKDIEESISHNIFYTAITRAKKSLKIYCDKTSLNNICNNFKKIDYINDSIMIKSRIGNY